MAGRTAAAAIKPRLKRSTATPTGSIYSSSKVVSYNVFAYLLAQLPE
jgi:hypothetical protein